MHSNGDSFSLSDGHSMSASAALAASTYPEPFYVRLLGPVQPGAV
jgi:hypothetical protein